MKPYRRRILCGALALVLLSGLLPCETHARIRLESICTIEGQREQQLMGLGLVIGLKATGDGGDHLPTIRALAAALKLFNNPVEKEAILSKTSNVALVMVSATIPATGIRAGQKVDCQVNSIGSAKSLRNGYLMMTPLKSGLVADERLAGIASGALQISESGSPTSGVISDGVVVEQDFAEFASLYIKDNGFNLLLDEAHASFRSASEVADAINRDFSFGAQQNIAKPLAPGVIRVNILDQYRDDPVDFVGQVLNVGVDNANTEARVILNSRTGVVIVTAEVEISPVIISHKSLSITVGDPGQAGDVAGPFVGLMENSRQAPQHLQELIEALNQLKVPTADIIDIIKDLHRSGKLHAVLITE